MKKKQVSMFLCALLTLAQVVPAFAGVQADEGIVVEEAVAEEEIQAVAAEEETEAALEAIEAVAEEEIQAVAAEEAIETEAAEEETEESVGETSEAEDATGEMDTLGDFEIGYYDLEEEMFVGSVRDNDFENIEESGTNSLTVYAAVKYYLSDGDDIEETEVNIGKFDAYFSDSMHRFSEKAENLNGGDKTLKEVMEGVEAYAKSHVGKFMYANIRLRGVFDSGEISFGTVSYCNGGDRCLWGIGGGGYSSLADDAEDWDYFRGPIGSSCTNKWGGTDGLTVGSDAEGGVLKVYDISTGLCHRYITIDNLKPGPDPELGDFVFNFDETNADIKGLLDEYKNRVVTYMVVSPSGNYSRIFCSYFYAHTDSSYVTAAKLNKAAISWADGSAPDYTYDGLAHIPEIKVTIHGTPVSRSDYTVEYYVKGMKVAPEDVTEAGKVTIKIVPAPGSDAKGAKTKTYKIKPRNLAASNKGLADIFTSTVNGGDDVPCDISGAKPEITISYNGVGALEEGTDFTVKYSGNKKVAEGSLTNNKSPRITVKGKGNYTGTAIVPFTIVQQDMDNLSGETIYNDVVNIPTGKAAAKLKNKPVIKNGNKKLKEGRDYTVTYTVSGNELDVSKNHSYADGTVVDVLIEAKKDASGNYTGNFKGKLELTYSISNKLIKNNMIVLDAGTKCDPANVEAFCSHVKVMDKVGGQKSEISHEYYNVKPTGVEPEVIAKGKNKGKVKVSVFVLGTGTEYGGKIMKTYIVEKAE